MQRVEPKLLKDQLKLRRELRSLFVTVGVVEVGALTDELDRVEREPAIQSGTHGEHAEDLERAKKPCNLSPLFNQISHSLAIEYVDEGNNFKN